MVLPVRADTIRWVDFGIPYESLKYAMDSDIDSFDKEKHIIKKIEIIENTNYEEEE